MLSPPSTHSSNLERREREGGREREREGERERGGREGGRETESATNISIALYQQT